MMVEFETELDVHQVREKVVELRAVSKFQQSRSGLVIAFSILFLWLGSLILLATLNVGQTAPWLIALAMIWQTFLYTGLFITGHDAMHGSICPKNVGLNHKIGTLVVFLYGFFSYKNLIQKHWQHHYHPASDRDPDFHDGVHAHFITWYCHFMQSYWSWSRLAALVLAFHLLHYGLQIPEINLTLFWVLPPLLSSLQLFYFGTFLPHQEPQTGYKNVYRAHSNNFPVVMSFLTCYHFGYHEEHHRLPHVPWWQLPQVRHSP